MAIRKLALCATALIAAATTIAAWAVITTSAVDKFSARL